MLHGALRIGCSFYRDRSGRIHEQRNAAVMGVTESPCDRAISPTPLHMRHASDLPTHHFYCPSKQLHLVTAPYGCLHPYLYRPSRQLYHVMMPSYLPPTRILTQQESRPCHRTVPSSSHAAAPTFHFVSKNLFRFPFSSRPGSSLSGFWASAVHLICCRADDTHMQVETANQHA